MQFLLSTTAAHGVPLEEEFRLAREAGFDGIEYLVTRTHPLSRPDLLRAIDGSGLPVLNVHAPFEPVPGWGSRIATVHRSVELAAELGAPSITLHPPQLEPEGAAYRSWFEGVSDFQKEVGGGRVDVTVENMPRPGRWRRLRSFHTHPFLCHGSDDFGGMAERHNLWVTLDTTHLGTVGESPLAVFNRLASRVRVVHLSNYRSLGNQEHLPPQSGDLNLATFLRGVQSLGFPGRVTVEVSPFYLITHPGGLRGSLEEMMGWIRESLRQEAQPALVAGLTERRGRT